MERACRHQFEVKPGSFHLLGLGRGKTTTLRSVAGLSVPTARDHHRRAQRFLLERGDFIPGNKRDVGMVFSRMRSGRYDGIKNVAYPLKAK